MPLRTKKSSSTSHPRAVHVGKVVSEPDGIQQTAPVAGPQAEGSPHLGDWIALYAWLACFALLLAMNAYDLLRALLNW